MSLNPAEKESRSSEGRGGTSASLIEIIPEYLTEWFEREGIAEEGIKLAVSSDLDLEGYSNRVWVFATSERICTVNERSFREDGQARPVAGEFRPSKGVNPLEPESLTSIPMIDITGFRIDNMIGNGLLVASVKSGSAKSCSDEETFGAVDRVVCRFSNQEARKFGLFCRLLDKVRKGEEITEDDVREDQIPRYCPKCGLIYPDFNRPVCPKCIDRRSLFKRVLSFLPRYKWQVTGILVCMILSSGLKVAAPYLSGRILYDEVLMEGGRWHGMLWQAVLLIMSAQALSLLLGITHGRINSSMTARLIYDLKRLVFDNMQRLSMRFFTGKQTGGLMTRVNHDALHLQYFLSDGMQYLIINLLMLLGILLSMLLLDWRLTFFILIPVPVVVWCMRVFLPYLWKLSSRRYRKTGAMNALINDVISGVRVIKAFGREDAEISRFSKRNRDLYSVMKEAGNFSHTFFPLMGVLMSFGSLAVWGFGGWQVIRGNLTFGTLISFVGYLGMLYGPLDFLTQVVDWWSSSMNSAQRIFEIVDAVPDVQESRNPVRLPAMRGEVEFCNVIFGYEPHKPVLHDINLHVKPGEMIGLVGHSGAGKSTVTNLVTRLYDVDSGVVKIDGIDVREIHMEDLRSQIGVVLQETFLFRGSIRENIAYARPDASEAEIIRAAKSACAHDFIVKLQSGYDTRIGTRGLELSGGEKQRIAIARSILHDPRIIILDEATSSLDTGTEQRIQAALANLVKGRTTFAIAHRLSTLRNADRIFVLENGRNVELGTHEELVGKKGVYYKLLTTQREALKIKGVDEEMDLASDVKGAEELDKELKEYTEVRYLKPDEITFALTPGGFVSMKLKDGREYARISAYKAFPFTDPDAYISIRDESDKEIGIIENLGELDPGMRSILDKELERRYYTPVILDVIKVEEEFGYSYWEVMTDRGGRRFTVQNTHDSAFSLSDREVLIIDVDGNRFILPDYKRSGLKVSKVIESMI